MARFWWLVSAISKGIGHLASLLENLPLQFSNLLFRYGCDGLTIVPPGEPDIINLGMSRDPRKYVREQTPNCCSHELAKCQYECHGDDATGDAN